MYALESVDDAPTTLEESVYRGPTPTSERVIVPAAVNPPFSSVVFDT